MRIITEEHGSFFVVKAVDENGNVLRRKDGTERIANSLHCKDPYKTVERDRVLITYSNKGIV